MSVLLSRDWKNYEGEEQRRTFCVSAARFKLANASVAPTVPRKIGLNWFIPALVKRRVASLCGTTEEEETAYSC
jgi:hypothetical protein